MTRPDNQDTPCENNKKRFAGLVLAENNLSRRVLFFDEFNQEFSELLLAETVKQRHTLKKLQTPQLLLIDHPIALVPTAHFAPLLRGPPYHTGTHRARGASKRRPVLN